MLVSTRDLTVEVGAASLFSGLDLAVDTGECLVVTGANGAGKSTLLRCLYLLQRPSSGTVSVCGAAPDERSAAFRRRVSVVLDDSALFEELTARQHLDLLGRSFGVARPVPAALASRADVPAGDPSAGRRRRLLLHAAVARPHSVLLLDEPERALDAEGLSWLTTLVGQSLSVVVDSHRRPLAATVADYVVDL
ncbi:ATP-binding cassette domain-containing protein [Amycolatopsis sp. FDAARGOS 1241]|uniref:ABC transporter ATP-binding protein n=1 Tax=Amycolatopsis sp. FDAARGOS 1241 TaxID=2778070 RepID=UPI001951EBC8|nr:ATP-binding cassette domain-containing protein [Amycolatopsis sp. FDAARGOS 1241]QRP46176.1 ATP-binding cassette domain-containing protein [Amycolatopsis sp. FDAARGOS 1241]